MMPYRKAEFGQSNNPKKKKGKPQQQDFEEGDVKNEETSKSSKHKPKFVPLFDGEAHNVILIPGRHQCQCLAARHNLIGNCQQCGRIVCAQEGSGPCLTCGALVCTREEREIIRQGDQKSNDLQKKLMGTSNSRNRMQDIAKELTAVDDQRINDGLEKALEKKNQLLEYDRTCEKRTRVIDDEADYFSVDSNQWLSAEERKLRKQKIIEFQEQRNSRKNKVTLDFAGRRIVEEKSVEELNFDDDLIDSTLYENDTISSANEDGSSKTAYLDYRPMYSNSESRTSSASSVSNVADYRKRRLQDRELQQMSDDGWCLSVHQPFASLLTSGIKRHEGRSWYTAHRGRLWIAAAAQQPTTKDIRMAEAESQVFSANEKLVFPEQYPVGCLLGCVDLVDCIAQEEYREEFPGGESGSPYVLICTNAQELIVKFPIQGKPKIYKLDERIHQAAQKTLHKKINLN